MDKLLTRLLAKEKDYDFVIIAMRTNRPPLMVDDQVPISKTPDGLLTFKQDVPHPMARTPEEMRQLYTMQIFLDPAEIVTVEYYTMRRVDTSGTGLIAGMKPVRD